jgi:Signal transduction histidine kinase
MNKVIFKKYIVVILLALCINGILCYFLTLNNDFIIRIAAPYLKINQNIYMLVITFIINLIMALIVSAFLASKFSKTIVIPLREISGEISKLGDRQPKFEFKEYEYNELNSISVVTKHMSETINETMERLEQEKVIRQEFFSNVSHELKTPITSIGGYAEMLENNLVTDENMRQDFLRRIKKEVLKMTSLINDILMISKLETKEIKRKFTKVRIGAVVEDVLVTLMPVAKDADIELKVNYMPITMFADEEHIRQLITNLLSNAVKYNKSGGYAMLDIKEEGKNIIIEIADNGVGIPENSLNRVFERFYRVDSGRSKKVGGTGLGLSIVKHIVQHYGGEISIKSKENVGTQIVVNIPNLPML